MPARINTPRNRQQRRRLAAADFFRRQQQKRIRGIPDELRALIDTLFGNGEAGAMYVPKPILLGDQNLWQMSDGTVIVDADGDPVGRNDDVSGNANHATQSVSADRPLYRTDGTLHWLEFSGGSVSLDAPGNLITGQSPWTLAMAGDGTASDETGWVDILGGGGGADALVPTFEPSLRTGGGFVSFGAAAGAPHAYRLTHPGNGNISDTRCWINGAERAQSGLNDAVLDLGATTTTELFSGIAGQFRAGIILPYEVTAEQGKAIDDYLATLI